MELTYKYAESTIKPSTIEVNENTVYLRKDISSVVRSFGQDLEVVYWTYQEATLTAKEFNEYTNLLMVENAINGKTDSANIIQIMAGQETGDSYQLAIMEAIADLYEMIAPLTEST